MKIMKIVLVVIIACFSFLKCKSLFYDDPTIGWVVENQVPDPFVPGIITNGQPPPNYEVTILEPVITTGLTAKADELRKFSVKVRISGEDSLNRSVPPTFAFLRIMQNHRQISKTRLIPFQVNGSEYVYSGQVPIPYRTGAYVLIGEVEYISVVASKGKVVSRNSFKSVTNQENLYVQ